MTTESVVDILLSDNKVLRAEIAALRATAEVKKSIGGGMKKPYPTPEFIEAVVDAACICAGCTRDEMLGNNRNADTVLARGVAAKVMRDMTRMSYWEIAKELRPGGAGASSTRTSIERTNYRMGAGDEATLKCYLAVRERVGGMI